MIELVGVETQGVIQTHMPDYTGSYETFCGLDGDDLGNDVNQRPAKAGSVVTCPHCIAAWHVAKKIKPRQIGEPHE